MNSTKQHTLIPEVRFPEFKEDWEVKKLNEIGNRITEKNIDFSVTLVLTNSATKGIISQEDFFDKKIANNKSLNNYYVASVDDFVYNPRISKYAPVGPLKRNHLDKGVLSPLYTILRFNKGNLAFFEHYFETKYWYRYLRSVANYGARHDRMNITNDSFIKLPIPFPTLPEQQKIAHFFSIVDKKLSQLQEKKTALEFYKKGMMQRLFVWNHDVKDSLDNHDATNKGTNKNQDNKENQEKSRFRQLRFRDDNGQDFPEWKFKKLGEICNISAGGDIGKLNFSKTKTEIHKYPVYANALTNNSLYGYSDIPKIKVDCVTVTGRGDVGFAFHRSANFTPVVRLLTLIPKLPTSNYFLKSTINTINIFVESTGVPQLTSPQLSSYKIQLPTLPEQTKIANFLSKIDNKINTVTEQIEQTKAYKKGLLQKMFV